MRVATIRGVATIQVNNTVYKTLSWLCLTLPQCLCCTCTHFLCFMTIPTQNLTFVVIGRCFCSTALLILASLSSTTFSSFEATCLKTSLRPNRQVTKLSVALSGFSFIMSKAYICTYKVYNIMYKCLHYMSILFTYLVQGLFQHIASRGANR